MPLPRSMLRMNPDELREFLTTQRTCRLATIDINSTPHITPMWFLYLDEKFYLSSLRNTARGSNLARGSKVAICVDAGESYAELCGVILYGTLEKLKSGHDVGDDKDHLSRIKREFALKYFGVTDAPDLPSYDWLILETSKVVSWDFKKIPSGRDKKLDLPTKSRPTA